MTPPVGVMRPILPAPDSVNHRLPSGHVTILHDADAAVVVENSPSGTPAVVIRPIVPSADSVPKLSAGAGGNDSPVV